MRARLHAFQMTDGQEPASSNHKPASTNPASLSTGTALVGSACIKADDIVFESCSTQLKPRNKTD